MARNPIQPAEAHAADAPETADPALQLQPGPGHVRTPALEALTTRP
jgi:hypothetical protein